MSEMNHPRRFKLIFRIVRYPSEYEPHPLHYGDHRWPVHVNGAGESHWSMSHGPENIYSDRKMVTIFAVVALLHLLRVYMDTASYHRRLDSADVGELDCFRRSGRLE